MNISKVNKVRSILHRGFLILWASAIFWFYLGNLVNFHQNRIWGKYLIPSCFTHSSVNKQDFGTLQHDDHTALLNQYNFSFDGIACDQCEYEANPVIFYLNDTDQDYFGTLISDPPVSVNSLRGPPLS